MPDSTCHPMGRLGNHMFILAAGYAHAKRNGYRFVINEAEVIPSYWNGTLAQWRQFIATSDESWIKRSEHRFSYTAIPAHVTSLFGYYQSSKYFSEYSDELRALFTPPQSFRDEVRRKWDSLKKELVVVHIRRGDYAMLPHVHGILNEVYFMRAMNLAPQGSKFAIFSDDIAWCKKQEWLAQFECTFVDEPDEMRALYLMSLFDSFILSNSTFSWWGAYLASERNVTVWAPDQWFHHSYITDYHDIYEPSWIRVPVV